MSCEVARALTGRLAKVLIGQGPCQDEQHAAEVFLVLDDQNGLAHDAIRRNSARMGGSICKLEPHPDAATINVEDLLVVANPGPLAMSTVLMRPQRCLPLERMRVSESNALSGSGP